MLDKFLVKPTPLPDFSSKLLTELSKNTRSISHESNLLAEENNDYFLKHSSLQGFYEFNPIQTHINTLSN